MELQSAPATRRLRPGAAPPPASGRTQRRHRHSLFLCSHHCLVLQGSIYLQEVTDDRRDGRLKMAFVNTESYLPVLLKSQACERHAVHGACVPGPARAGASSRGVGGASCARDSTRFGFSWGMEEGALRAKQFLTKNVCRVDQNLLKNKSPTFLGDLSKSILCSELPINLWGFRPIPLLLKYIFIILLQLCCSSYK